MLQKVKRYIFRMLRKEPEMSAVLDPEDGSITISEGLYQAMDKACGGTLEEVYCFQINDNGKPSYGWICNPKKSLFVNDDENVVRPVAGVQYNTRSNTIGFMPTNPTLALMYYNWGIEYDKKIRVAVSRRTLNDYVYFRIDL